MNPVRRFLLSLLAPPEPDVTVSLPVPLDIAAIQSAARQGYQQGHAEGERYGRQAACDDLIAYLRQLGRAPDTFEVEDVEEVRVRQVH